MCVWYVIRYACVHIILCVGRQAGGQAVGGQAGGGQAGGGQAGGGQAGRRAGGRRTRKHVGFYLCVRARVCLISTSFLLLRRLRVAWNYMT